MDVDSDIDATLLQQFSSMGTTDKEVLVSQFQRLLGDRLNAAGCAFFLDMTNWNLQAAIGAYYDYEQPSAKVPCAQLLRDITIGEGEAVPPNTHFVKTWRIQNTGDEVWPPGCSLKFVQGAQLGHRERVMVDAVHPGMHADISVEMQSPAQDGIYEGQWRMCTATGMYFGEIIWVILQVADGGLLGVTQQLSSFGSDFTQPEPRNPAVNPFASPVKMSSSTGMLTSSPPPASYHSDIDLARAYSPVRGVLCDMNSDTTHIKNGSVHEEAPMDSGDMT